MSEESGFLKVLITIISTVVGIIIGGLIGSVGFYYFCLIMDSTQGGSPGGFVGAGWALLFFTIPIGVLGGGGIGLCLSLFFCFREKP